MKNQSDQCETLGVNETQGVNTNRQISDILNTTKENDYEYENEKEEDGNKYKGVNKDSTTSQASKGFLKGSYDVAKISHNKSLSTSEYNTQIDTKKNHGKFKIDLDEQKDFKDIDDSRKHSSRTEKNSKSKSISVNNPINLLSSSELTNPYRDENYKQPSESNGMKDEATKIKIGKVNEVFNNNNYNNHAKYNSYTRETGQKNEGYKNTYTEVNETDESKHYEDKKYYNEKAQNFRLENMNNTNNPNNKLNINPPHENQEKQFKVINPQMHNKKLFKYGNINFESNQVKEIDKSMYSSSLPPSSFGDKVVNISAIEIDKNDLSIYYSPRHDEKEETVENDEVLEHYRSRTCNRILKCFIVIFLLFLFLGIMAILIKFLNKKEIDALHNAQ